MALAAARLATAAMDISDGLGLDLARLCAASGVGAEIEAERVPHPPGASGLRLALAGGEDYELLFTVPRRRVPEAGRLAAATGVAVTEIGAITAAPGLWLRQAGRRRRWRARGWDHFRPA